MEFARSSGILLHITSLPGPGGIGSFGKNAYEFIDFLEKSGQTLWQILPLNPIGSGNCPYCSHSTFAGNHLLIDMELLFNEDLITLDELNSYAEDNPYTVNYAKVNEYKNNLLKKAYIRFIKKGLLSSKKFVNFSKNNLYWLEEFAAYKVYKNTNAKNIKDAYLESELINFEKFVQYIFFNQWFNLKNYANEKGIRIIGDLPFYVPLDSADVFFNQDLFSLDYNNKPVLVSGVPPDYFSVEGQLWNTPVYNWEEHKKQGYKWWLSRISHALNLTDIVRLDHFRAFSEFWAVDSKEETAVNGKWIKGPGEDLLDKLYKEHDSQLPVIAEDLGYIDSNVEKLRDKYNLYGMRILQFAFDDLNNNVHLPHNHIKNTAVYTGTHDNNTTLGWYFDISDTHKERVRRYLRSNGSNICWDLIACAYSSPSSLSIIPLQDILCFGKDTRMNIPGTHSNNWRWRFKKEMLSDEIIYKLKALCTTYYR